MAKRSSMDCSSSYAPRKPERTYDSCSSVVGGDCRGAVKGNDDALYEELVSSGPSLRNRCCAGVGPAAAWDSLVLYEKPFLSEADVCDETTELTYTDSWSTLCSQDSIILAESGRDEARDDTVLVIRDEEPSKKVSFSTVEIREYAVTLGDNPSCQGPFSLELDWDYSPSRLEDAVRYLEFELTFGNGRSKRRRRRGCYRLSPEERLKRVLELHDWQHVRLREVQLILERVIRCVTKGLEKHAYLDAPVFPDLDDYCR